MQAKWKTDTIKVEGDFANQVIILGDESGYEIGDVQKVKLAAISPSRCGGVDESKGHMADRGLDSVTTVR